MPLRMRLIHGLTGVVRCSRRQERYRNNTYGTKRHDEDHKVSYHKGAIGAMRTDTRATMIKKRHNGRR